MTRTRAFASVLASVLSGVVGCSLGTPEDVDGQGWPIDPACEAGQRCPDTKPVADAQDLVPVEDGGDLSHKGGPMMRIPGGTFLRGSRDYVTLGHEVPIDYPPHEVELSSYAIDKHEVTVAWYKRCVDEGACTLPLESFEQEPRCNWAAPGRGQHPINCVSWDQADAFCRWAGKQLPTEAQWEMAARGPDSLLFPWGDEPNPTCERAIVALDYSRDEPFGPVYGCDLGTTWPVGSRPLGASVFGVHDLVGNVGEWTSDVYLPYYDDHFILASKPIKDPVGPTHPLDPELYPLRMHVVKGSDFRAWHNVAYHSALRLMVAHFFGDYEKGLRCAKALR